MSKKKPEIADTNSGAGLAREKRSPRRSKIRKSPASKAEPAEDETYYRDLGEQTPLIENVKPSPLNPRKTFDQVRLQTLADSIAKHGQLQPVVMRLVGSDGGGAKQYELISGERRWRAVALAGVLRINGKVIECDDRTAIELRGMENFERQDFNPIEEAIWFQQMIDHGGYDQTSLAKLVRLDRSQISNRIRLLKLPVHFQEMVIDGSLPATHAREIVSWVDYPMIMDAVELAFRGREIADSTVSSLKTILITAVTAATRSMDDARFELTKALIEDLRVVQVPRFAGDDVGHLRAFNKELWDELQEKSPGGESPPEPPSRSATKSSNEPKNEGVVDDSGPMAEEIERVEISNPDDVHLKNHFVEIFAKAIDRELKPAVALKLFTVLWACDNPSMVLCTIGQLSKVDIGEFPEQHEVYDIYPTMSPKNFASICRSVVSEFLRREPETYFDLAVMVKAAKEIGIDPISDWKPDIRILGSCSDTSLTAFFEMVDLKSLDHWNRAERISHLVEFWPPGEIPELLKPSEFAGEEK
jgi:ParB/RepB/Spo0J family partition protein